MRMSLRAVTVLLIVMRLSAAPPAGSKEALLSRMDKAAGEFKAMSAQVTYVTHTDVLNEDNTETGTVAMKKVQPGEVQGLVDFLTPDPHSVLFEKRQLKRYYPKIKTLEVYDLDKHGEQLDKFLMIGFGTSGSELAKDYDVTVLPAETIKGQPGLRVVRLRLIPKSAEAREYVKSLELWIPEQGDAYPLRERIVQPSGDQQTISYSELKINPTLNPSALQLKLPPGVKTVFPGK